MSSPLDDVAGAVASAKSGSPLSQVTVVVPTLAAGRDVIHHLARTGAVANTEAVTLPQVVNRLAAPVLAPRQPLPYPLLEAAVERALVEEPGRFSNVSDEPITARALAGAIAKLSEQESPHLDDPTPVVTEMLRIREQVLRRLTGRYYLAHEAFAAARARLGGLGEIVIYAPNPTTPAADALLAELQARGTTVEFEPEVSPTQVIHTSDADDEVRAVVRLVRKQLAGGIPGHRIGIFYGTEDPYLPLLHENLTDGEIVFSGPECHSLVDRPIGRSLLGLLDLDPEKLPRRELFAILAEGAMHRPTVGDEPASLRKLETLTRRYEPIVGGVDWERLTRVPAEESHHALASGLWNYITELRADFAAILDAKDWQTVADGLNRLLNLRFRIPKSEIDGIDLAHVRADCAALAHMDGIAPPPNAARIRDALDVRFRGRGGVHGRSGVGVSIGPLSSGVGRDLDVSIVIGAADGIIPMPRRDDPLLPEELLGVSARDHIEHQERIFESAVTSGRVERIVTFPRGNLRGGAEKVPSRWLLPALGTMAGKEVTVVDWLTQTRDAVSIVAVESFDVAAQTADPRIGTSAASATEWRLRELAAVPADRRQGALDDRRINLGMRMRSDRLNGRFTRFNGNLADVHHLLKVFDKPVAPTGLEMWVESPYRFFLEKVLGLRGLPDPDEVAQINAIEKGTRLHKVFEEYIGSMIAGDDPDHGRLQHIADRILSEAEAENPGWLAQLWAKDRGALVRDISTWYDHDTVDRAAGWLPVAVEDEFKNDSAISFDLGDAHVFLSGSVDRIDQHRDGRIRVTDYKSGQAKKYNDITEANPTDSGKRVQLPTYGLFARTLGDQVSARYWFTSSAGKFGEVGYDITDPVVEIFRADLRLIHHEIMAGHFPPKTPESFFDDPLIDLIGRTSLRRAWASLENVDELDDYTQKYGAQ